MSHYTDRLAQLREANRQEAVRHVERQRIKPHPPILRGEDSPFSILTWNQVLMARHLRTLKNTYPEIKDLLGVNVSIAALRNAVIGRTWAHV